MYHPGFYFFSTLFGASVIFQLLSCTCIPYNIFHEYQVVGFSELLLFALACWLLIRPCTSALIAVSAVHLLNFFFWLPHAPNHRVLFACASASILLTIVVLRKRIHESSFASELWETVLPLLRVQTIILYFAATFHKLNWDFVNPAGSCVTVFYGHIRDVLPILPFSVPLLTVFAWLTLLVEGSLPFLLLFNKSRPWGILLGLFFHFFLALDVPKQFLNFSSVMFVFLCSFLPPDFYQRLKPRDGGWPGRGFRILFVCCAVQILLAAFVTVQTGSGSAHWGFTVGRQLLWWISSTALIGVIVRLSPPWVRKTSPAPAQPLRLKKPIQKLIPLLLIVNATLPYVGIKNRSSFDMYSNLQLEAGRSNHFFMPPSLDLLANMHDLVSLTESSDPTLVADYIKPGLLITWFELRRYASSHPDISLTYERGGTTYNLLRAADNPELVKPLGQLEKRLLWYRPVDPNSPSRCLW